MDTVVCALVVRTLQSEGQTRSVEARGIVVLPVRKSPHDLVVRRVISSVRRVDYLIGSTTVATVEIPDSGEYLLVIDGKEGHIQAFDGGGSPVGPSAAVSFTSVPRRPLGEFPAPVIRSLTDPRQHLPVIMPVPDRPWQVIK